MRFSDDRPIYEQIAESIAAEVAAGRLAAEAAEAPQEPRKGGSQLSAKVLYMVRLAVLIALIVVMSMTPIGYLKLGTIEVSFLTLPVIIDVVLGFTDVKIPFFFLIYHVLAAVFIAIGLKRTSEAGQAEES